MDKKEKIAAIVAVISSLFGPCDIKIEKIAETLKEKAHFTKPIREPSVWALSGRSFMMDKRWEIQFRAFCR